MRCDLKARPVRQVAGIEGTPLRGARPGGASSGAGAGALWRKSSPAPSAMSRFACPEPPGVALHLIQRGRGRARCFFGARDGIAYLRWLREYAMRFECAVHAYVLMRNHVHLLVTPARERGGSDLMRSLGGCYARHVADTRGLAGPLWEERFEAAPVYVPRYLLSCMRYIEENPVRAGLASDPGEYRWSSYGANAWGREDPLVTPHALYYALGRSPEWRRARYRAMFWRPTSPAPSTSPAGNR